MHADTLYHRMLERERAVDAAKAAGLPIPSFPPILSSIKPSRSISSELPVEKIPLDPALDQLAPKIKAQLRDRFKGLSPEEREVEMKAMIAELTAGETVSKKVDDLHTEAAKARRLRKERGKETVGDKMASWFGL